MKNGGYGQQAMLVAICFLFQGCLKIGPDYKRPELDFQIPGQYHQADQKDREAKDADRWWESFNNSKINELVDQVIQSNLDIQKSTASVLEFDARHTQTRSRRFPSLSGTTSARRSQSTTPSFSFPPLALTDKRTTTNSFNLSLPASFELDIWGRLARADQAARFDLIQVEAVRLTVMQSIVAEAVSLYLEMESLERRIAVNRLRIENFDKNLRLVEKRYAAGLSSGLEIRQTRRSLSQAQSVMPTLHVALGTVQHRLAVLSGKYPETSPVQLHPETYYQQVAPVPNGLPSELLLRRPDIKAAEAALAAASARIGEARAGRFPSIALTGTYGNTNSALSELFVSGSDFWNLAAGITVPIFDAGSRKAGEKAARARYEQQLASYAKTVLTAFSEVETALITREQQLVRREQLLDYLAEARAVQEMAIQRYEKGLVDYINVLDAVISRFRAEEDIILSDLALMQNRVTLYRALGGGWAAPDAPLGPWHESKENLDQRTKG